ncbi:MAG: shikimate kinase [Planctomycetota bacterium]|jgi:XRE family aerobic/anaerobic benzoate catabolism transcriptional regulator|nr:shikimate kinase [Planctomycetota bacterium]
MVAREPLLQRVGVAVLAGRKTLGWSRREMARRAGVSERFLADVERGLANPSLLRLAEIATALGTTPATLLTAVPAAGDRAQVIALLGLRGAGKSTVGAALADRLGWSFVELDEAIESAAGMSLSEIFELHGEAWYRRAERDAVASALAGAHGLVLAVGGGLVTEPATLDYLRAHARTVWLKARPEEHWSRVVAQGDMRPMRGDGRAFEHLCAILSERERLYRLAELTVNTSDRTIDQIAGDIATKLDGAGI